MRTNATAAAISMETDLGIDGESASMRGLSAIGRSILLEKK